MTIKGHIIDFMRSLNAVVRATAETLGLIGLVVMTWAAAAAMISVSVWILGSALG